MSAMDGSSTASVNPYGNGSAASSSSSSAAAAAAAAPTATSEPALTENGSARGGAPFLFGPGANSAAAAGGGFDMSAFQAMMKPKPTAFAPQMTGGRKQSGDPTAPCVCAIERVPYKQCRKCKSDIFDVGKTVCRRHPYYGAYKMPVCETCFPPKPKPTTTAATATATATTAAAAAAAAAPNTATASSPAITASASSTSSASLYPKQ